MKYQSNLLSDARGKLNGMVFTRGRYGAVIRTKVSPVQPDTNAQQLTKQNFGALSASFRALTEDQIAGWNTAALNWPRSNVFGQTYYPSGLNLYVGLNQNLLQAEEATITAAPSPTELPVMTPNGVVIDDSANTFIAIFQMDGGTIVPAGYNLLIDATGAISPGRSFVKNMFRQITVIAAGADTSATDLNSFYVARFGSPITGQKIYVQARLIAIASGQASLPVQQSGIVVA